MKTNIRDFDPPESSFWRQLFVQGLNPRATARIEPMVRSDVVSCLTKMAVKHEADVVTDLADVVPTRAVFYLLGIEERRKQDWARDHARKMLGCKNDPEAFATMFRTFADFGFAEAETRRREPRDDFLTVLAHARRDGQLLTAIELGSAMNSILAAGSGTTAAAITNMLWEILSRPDIRRQLLSDRSLVPAAVEEGLRLHNPFFGLFRRATKDVMVGDVTVPEGGSVFMCWQAANRDPAMFDDPQDFRLDRDATKHLAFGMGRHSCVGASAARMELRIVLEEILSRYPHAALAGQYAPDFHFVGSEVAAIPSLILKLGQEGSS